MRTLSNISILAVVTGVLANAGFALADDTTMQGPLSLKTVITVSAADGGPSGLLMQGLDQLGVGDPLRQAGINVYGWLEVGYTVDARRHRGTFIAPGPFNHEFGVGDRNHLMLNQFVLRFEREAKFSPDKWDVGGLVEFMYGTDANAIHANGFGLGFSGADDRFNPQYQPDFVQVFVDVNVPVGNGLKLRTGKQVNFMGVETIDPRGNAFYSHSYIFAAMPSTLTGLVGFYPINEQWFVAAGFTRGWDQALHDNNSAIDGVAQIRYSPNKQLTAVLSFAVGPENNDDTSHYRVAVDSILYWQPTDRLKLALEVTYVYDGGIQGDKLAGVTHAYGDVWASYAYGSYEINDHLTANARLGFLHNYVTANAFNVWDLTLGVTVKPFPKDPIGKNLIIRPEIRYSYAETDFYMVESGGGDIRFFRDQFTFGADVVFSF